MGELACGGGCLVGVVALAGAGREKVDTKWRMWNQDVVMIMMLAGGKLKLIERIGETS